MEFLVEFDLTVPDGTPEDERRRRDTAETAAAAELARRGQLVRLWTPQASPGERRAMGVYRAGSRTELDALLAALPLADWMDVTVTELRPHPNDPAPPAGPDGLPLPRLTLVYHLEVSLGAPLELGDTPAGRRRFIPLTGGTFTGPQLSGTLVPGVSADWQTVLPDGTALGDVRYTLRTQAGDLIAVRARSVRHGSPEVLARLARGDTVDPAAYVFRGITGIETAAPALDWLNKGVFVTVGARLPAGVAYETYLVG